MDNSNSDKSLEHSISREEFNQAVIKSFIACSPELYENIINKYQIYCEDKNCPEDKFVVNQESMRAFVQFIHSENFNDNNVNDYFKTCNSTMNLTVFCFLLWSHNKKDAWLEMLKNNSLDTNQHVYESCMAVAASLSLIPRSLTHTEEEKNEFIYCQKNFSLVNSIQQTPNKDDTKKKPKL